MSIDPGFSPAGLSSLHLSLPASRYPSGASLTTFYSDLLARARALPGVADAAAVSEPPLASGREVFYTVEGEPAADERQAPVATSRAVSAGYFRVAGIPLRQGRLLTDADNAAVAQIDRDQPVDHVQTMDEAVATTLAPRRCSAALLTGFAALALALAAACAVLLGAALLACYLPARRASRIDPVLTLRQD